MGYKFKQSSCWNILLTHQTCPLVTLFRKLKKYLRGNKYGDYDEVMSAVNDWLDEQPKELCSKGIQALVHRWKKCLAVARDYVEK